MKEKMYLVSFDTQKNRIYSTWAFVTYANNKKNAIERAREAWYLKLEREEHMFHCEAEQITDHGDLKIETFKETKWRPVTWGRASQSDLTKFLYN